MAGKGEPFTDYPDVAAWRVRHLTEALAALFKAQVSAQRPRR